MDTISTGSTIGFAYELYEKGILSKGDTDGLELTYGNPASMISLIKKTQAGKDSATFWLKGLAGRRKLSAKGLNIMPCR